MSPLKLKLDLNERVIDKFRILMENQLGVSISKVSIEDAANQYHFRFTIGDGASHNQGPHIGLYTSEDGIRKFKPLLKSCKITNEGGGDYTDSYLYNIEFSFTVFTMEEKQLKTLGNRIHWSGQLQSILVTVTGLVMYLKYTDGLMIMERTEENSFHRPSQLVRMSLNIKQ